MMIRVNSRSFLACLSLCAGLFLMALTPASAVGEVDFYTNAPGTPDRGGPDGVDDVWQSIYNAWGLSPTADTDFDGCINSVEAIAGTDPRNPSDCIKVGNMSIAGNTVTFTFDAEAGKQYSIISDDLPTGPYATTVTLTAPVTTTTFIPTADNANQTLTITKAGADVRKFYKLKTVDADTDNDGVSDWAERKLGMSATTNDALALDTVHSLMSLTATMAAAGYERNDKTLTTPAVVPAKVALVRTFGTMALNGLTLLGAPGAPDDTKSSAVSGTDYVALGGTINIPANQGVPGTPFEVNITPVQDAVEEVPEYIKVSIDLPGASTSPGPSATVTIGDADPTNENNNQLYVAYLGREAGITSTASGYATAVVKGDNSSASISVTFNNLSSEQNTAYIRSGPNSDLAPALPNGQVSGFNYNVEHKEGFYSTDQAFLTNLAQGNIWCAITSANFSAKEIAGPFNKANGGTTFDPNRPDLVAPTGDWQNPTGEALEREIWRFLSQATFGGTQALYDEVLAEVNAAPNGPTKYITGLSNWLDKQMNPSLTPSINLRTLVMAEDNEDFMLRGNKPSTYISDPQINGSTYTVTYDAAGNPTIGTTADTNRIGNNYPQQGPNRRRAWWSMVLQCKDQVRQRMAQALSEITIISEADQTVLDRHLGCANYWDMLAENAFGKYRVLLEKVSYSPMMGFYLTSMANRQYYEASPGLWVSPDENYAREIMQLFSIGLILRHPDGSLKLSAEGLPVATYDNNDITEMARVMTGWSHGARHAQGYQSNWNGNNLTMNNATSQRISDLVLINGSSANNTWFGSDPGHLYWAAPWIYDMKLIGKIGSTIYHDFGAKTLLAGKSGQTIVPAQTVVAGDTDVSAHAKAVTDMTIAHNCLAGDPTSNTSYNGHENTPVNMSRWLIQRYVTSNPSAGYIYRVQKIYRDTNGNLGAVLKGILLDYEARSLALADSSISHGKVKEPMIAFASMLRSLRAFSGAPISTLKDNPPPFSGTDSPLPGPYPQAEFDKFSTDNTNPPSLPTGWATGPFRFRFGDTTGNLGQSPQRPPSVFNWFLPDYVLPGPMAEAGLFAPELQISTESSEVAKTNFFYAYTWSNLTGMSTQPGSDSNIADFLLNNSFATPAVRFSLDGGVTFVNSLTFTAANWNTAQNITVVGANTSVMSSLDNSQLRFNITGAGSGYETVTAPPVDITLVDNEIPNEGILALHTGFSTWVQESGKTDTVNVRLAAPPPTGTTVTVNVTTTSGQVTVSPTSFTFSSSTWNTNQTATVTAAVDTNAELPGAAGDTLTFTAAPGSGIYTGLFATVPVGVVDNSAAAGTNAFDVLITETSGSTDISESTATAVSAGIVDSYTIVLTRQPSADVIVTCRPSNTQVQLNTSGTTFAAPGGAVTRTFTNGNWSTPQTVLVRGNEDTAAEGSHPTNPMHFSSIAHSVGATGGYAATSALQPVVAAIADNDNRIILTHVGNGETRVREGGSLVETTTPETITVALRTVPAANVTVNLGSNSVVCNPTNLIFTPSNYNIAQTVTVTAVDDFVNEGAQIVPSIPGATATSTITSGAVTGVTITSPGAGYASAPSVTFTTIGSGATAGTVTRAGNAVTAIAVGAAGSGYLNPPTVTITGGGGTGATATAVLNASGGVASFTITSGGSGYTSSPTVTLTSGSGAAGTAIISNAGVVTGVTITNPGTGYVTPPLITFGTAVNLPSVITASATSETSETNYNNYWGNSYTGTFTQMLVTVLDNDAAALVVTPSGGSTVVSEGPVTDDLSFALSQQPSSNVTVTLAPGTQLTLSGATLASNTLTFTPANWSTAQTVTVSGINDTTVEGDALTNIGVLITSSDKTYAGLKAKPVPVTVIDNDLVPITIGHSNVFTGVSEGGTAGTNGTPNVSDNFTVVLPKTPTGTVTVTISSDSSQVSVSPSVLTFTTTTGQAVSGTTSGHNVAQTVTVTAVDDALPETTPHNTALRFAVSSSDPFYNNPAHLPVIVPIRDNDSPGFSIVENITNSAPLNGGNTTPTEAATDTYSVVLTKQPPAGQVVVIDVASANTADLTVSPATLTFTNANWNVAQTVTCSAVADMITEGRELVNVTNTINPTTTTDNTYDALPAQTVVNFITDQHRRNDSLVIIPSGGSMLTGGATATGGNTFVAEGDAATDTVDFYLSNPPTIPVTVTLSANAQMGFNQSVFYFTPANWNVPQTVVVSAVDDIVNDTYSVINGAVTQVAQSQNITFNLTGDPLFSGNNPTSAVNILDNDSPAVKITQSDGITSTTEGGVTDSYNVVLTTAPNNNVVVTCTPATGSTINGSTSAINLTFTTGNWNSPQTVTVLATNDTGVEGNHQANITHTINAVSTTDTSGYRRVLTNCNYSTTSTTVTCDSTVGLATGMIVIGTGIPANATIASISSSNTTTFTLSATPTTPGVNAALSTTIVGIQTVVNNINDNDNLVIVTPTGTDTRVQEDGSFGDTYSVVLRSAPGSSVTVTPTVPTGQGLVISPSNLVFTTSNWASPQIFTLSGVDNNISAERARTVTITHAATGGSTAAVHSVGVNMLAKDTMPRLLLVSNPAVNENGNTSTYTVALSRAPNADVSVAIDSGTQLEWAPPLVAPATALTYASTGTLNFTTTNWMNFQTVTVRAVDDIVAEQNINVGSSFIHTGEISHTMTSASASGYELPSVSLTGCATSTTTNPTTVTCVSTAGLMTGMALSGSGMAVGATVASVTNSTTFVMNLPATANGTGVTLSANVIIPKMLTTIIDNETPAVRVIPSGGSTQIVEGGAADTYDIVLSQAPTADVTIDITPDGQSTVSASTVTFTTGNWSTAQPITVTAVNDGLSEGNHSTTITHGAAVSTDPNFSGLFVPSVTGSITDNEGKQLVVTQTGGTTSVTEGGANDTISIQLSEAPTANVTVTLIPPMYIIPVPPYAKQYGYYTSDLSGSNQNRERVVVDYTEIIQLYRDTFYNKLEFVYGTGNIPPVPADVELQKAHWDACKAIVNKMDLWWCGGRLKAKYPDATHIIQPHQAMPPALTLPQIVGQNPRQVILDCLYQINGGANSPGTTRYLPEIVFDPKNPPTGTFHDEIRDRARWAGYLMSTTMPGFVAH